MPADEYLTFKEVQAYLKRSRPTIHRLINTGVITPYYRPISAAPLFKRSEIETLNVPVPRPRKGSS